MLFGAVKPRHFTQGLPRAQVYRCSTCPPGVKFEHFATAFTEHFPVVHAARHYFGMPVVADLRVVAQHADLPAHGEGFHGEGTPDDVWDAWLAPYVGHRFSEPAVVADRAHPERLKPQAPVVLATSPAGLGARLQA